MNRRAFLRQVSTAAASALAPPLLNAGSAWTWAADPSVFSGTETFHRLLARAQERAWRDLPIGQRTGAIGMDLRHTPYVSATLELYEDREVCSVNLLGLDCVTFFEIALAFARMLKRGGSTPQALLDEVTFIRYRGGILTDYTSRLHYTADWFFDNEQKGVVRVVTRELPGARRFTKTVSYMSRHPESYRQLRANPDRVAGIARIEGQINARTTYYVPREQVTGAQRLLMTGDIVGITTSIAGLDVSHTGLAYRDAKGVLRLLHASTTKKEVTLDDELAKHLATVRTHTGIMVARPVEA